MLRILLLITALAAAGPVAAGTGRASLDAFLDGLTSMQARFAQSVLDRENARAGNFEGLFYLVRPGRFLWQYEQPEPKRIIADGKSVWVVEEELKQISQQSQSTALKGTPASILAEEVALDEEFEVIDIGLRQELNWLELIPRDEESQFIRILLAFDGEELRRLEMADKFGQISRFVFSEVQRNPEIDPKMFDFLPPNGFDLFYQ